MKKDSVIIWVDFEEFKPETYKGVWASEDGNIACRSYTGDFKTDYAYIMKYAELTGRTIINSSSVDDWYMDNNKRIRFS